MEKFQKSTVIIGRDNYEDLGGRKFDEEAEEFELKLLDEFRSALEDMDNLKFPMNDTFLLRFLRTKKYNVAAAVKVTRKYFELRNRYREMLLVPFTKIQEVLESKFATVLKHRDENGSFIAWFRIRYWNPKVFTFDEMLTAVYYLSEEATTRKDIQKAGIIAIIDCTGLTLGNAADIAKDCSIRQIRKMVAFYQGSFPAKFKKVIGINLPTLFTTVYSVAKYLLKIKLRNRVHFSSSGPEVIHEHISPNILPVDLEGFLTYEEAKDSDIIDSTIKNEPYFRDQVLRECQQFATTKGVFILWQW